MKKRIIAITAAAACAAFISVCGAVVSADVIAVPIGDVFFDDNEEHCEYIKLRRYIITEDCILYNNPTDKKEISNLVKGQVIAADFSYTDENGDVWINWCYDRDNDKYGWLRYDCAEVIYDGYSFEEEHEKEYADYEGEMGSFKPEKQVVIWSYPNSGEILSICEAQYWFTDPDYFLTVDENADYTWTDENGEKWIYFGYGFNGWVYLSDPETETVNGKKGQKLSYYSEEDADINIMLGHSGEDSHRSNVEASLDNSSDNPETKTAGFALPIALAAGVCGISAGAIYRTRKK